MVSKFKDPACIKFINGRFILATNDPVNPITLVRQKTKGIDTDVIVTLSTGEMYDDVIDSISQLIEVTSNKGWLISIDTNVDIVIDINGGYDLSRIVHGTQMILRTLSDYDYVPDNEYYLPVSEMIPNRVSLQSVSSNLEFFFHNDRICGTEIMTTNYAILSPDNCIEDIAKELADNLLASFRQSTNINVGCITASRHSIISIDIVNCDLDCALGLMSPTSVPKTMVVNVEGQTGTIDYKDINRFAETLISISQSKLGK